MSPEYDSRVETVYLFMILIPLYELFQIYQPYRLAKNALLKENPTLMNNITKISVNNSKKKAKRKETNID